MPKLPNYLHLLGIRHHGPGSARGLVRRLSALEPDCILIEGPSDANDIIHWLADPEMQPPIALLVYRPDQPNQGTFFPFATFSPEYQAMRFALAHDITVRFFDLPQAHMLATPHKPKMPDSRVFEAIAAAAGYPSYEQWWHLVVEQRQKNPTLFAGILELMTAMRQQAEADAKPPTDETAVASQRLADQREAHMRRAIRQAHAAGFERIAVVCGAWHAPALVNLETAVADDDLLADMPAMPVETAWVPWTYGRLSFSTGYGAGIHSPGWYHHLWESSAAGLATVDISTTWLSQVAQLLRHQDVDASAAHVIEAVRLAEALAAMRHLPTPGLPELNEAIITIMCGGDATPMQLIEKKLIVSERMGMVPPGSPMVPLQRDLYRQQQQLRLHPEPEKSSLALDLRDETDLARSHLLHRLNLLKIPWGKLRPTGHKMGTYQEAWQVQWQPDFAIRVIEASMWGNTVARATANFAQDQADQAKDLPALTTLLDQIILAELPDTVLHLIAKIEERAALSSDVPHMMGALPPLARVLRYGSVRQTDLSVIEHVVDSLITRICIGLPSTAVSLDDDAATEMSEHVTAVHTIIQTLQNDEHLTHWEKTLRTLADKDGVHGLLSGKTCRLLLDARWFDGEDVALRMRRILSPRHGDAQHLTQIAAWIDGFLQGSGLLVLHDQLLWQLLDDFITRLDDGQFQTVLPLLRRTFSSFSDATRQQINQRVRQGQVTAVDSATHPQFDEAQATAVLPTLAELLGLEMIAIGLTHSKNF